MTRPHFDENSPSTHAGERTQPHRHRFDVHMKHEDHTRHHHPNRGVSDPSAFRPCSSHSVTGEETPGLAGFLPSRQGKYAATTHRTLLADSPISLPAGQTHVPHVDEAMAKGSAAGGAMGSSLADRRQRAMLSVAIPQRAKEGEVAGAGGRSPSGVGDECVTPMTAPPHCRTRKGGAYSPLPGWHESTGVARDVYEAVKEQGPPFPKFQLLKGLTLEQARFAGIIRHKSRQQPVPLSASPHPVTNTTTTCSYRRRHTLATHHQHQHQQQGSPSISTPQTPVILGADPRSPASHRVKLNLEAALGFDTASPIVSPVDEKAEWGKDEPNGADKTTAGLRARGDRRAHTSGSFLSPGSAAQHGHGHGGWRGFNRHSSLPLSLHTGSGGGAGAGGRSTVSPRLFALPEGSTPTDWERLHDAANGTGAASASSSSSSCVLLGAPPPPAPPPFPIQQEPKSAPPNVDAHEQWGDRRDGVREEDVVKSARGKSPQITLTSPLGHKAALAQPPAAAAAAQPSSPMSEASPAPVPPAPTTLPAVMVRMGALLDLWKLMQTVQGVNVEDTLRAFAPSRYED
ncbi:unnamed protein product [Vitrella brassicaformis CCMP3155]|uniref:Uncharacterized protein n=1 Tax=Vitrella brassicaformis (strain CCMP3155) TaxID=1169540 RepID=A0A0G4EGH6_VITBC|nr:unnamed protein product [Vitrella brassicaformis CCMP3155]|eukprot:CEL95341.1 unnamed protein product [Vitrella brassicaformis CCMP3155]